MKRTLWFEIILSILIPVSASAADAYFIRFGANGAGNAVGSRNVIWSDDILFFNTTNASLDIKFVGVSNGPAQADTPSLRLPPGRPVSLSTTGLNQRWVPLPYPALWVLHLDVPAGVVAESRDEFYVTYDTGAIIFPTARGKVSMPIFQDLTPANVPQVYLGTDLSGNESRTNVGIYNAGTETAMATIELRRVCDNEIADTRVVAIPPDVIVQSGGLAAGTRPAPSRCPEGGPAQWEMYTVIRVSQPSLSYVANINDKLQSALGESGYVPVVGLAVATNRAFR